MKAPKDGKRTERANLDFYPTPAPVAHVLGAWIAATPFVWMPARAHAMLDPAAGDGDLIEGLRDVPAFAERHWSAIEIDPAHAKELEFRAENVVLADALSVDWPKACVVANPPFNALDDFWPRIAAHRDRHAVWCAVLTPVAWWQAERRAGYTRPDVVLALNWRPVFRRKAGPGHKGSQDFVWAVLTPKPLENALWFRLPKPRGAPAQEARDTA